MSNEEAGVSGSLIPRKAIEATADPEAIERIKATLPMFLKTDRFAIEVLRAAMSNEEPRRWTLVLGVERPYAVTGSPFSHDERVDVVDAASYEAVVASRSRLLAALQKIANRDVPKSIDRPSWVEYDYAGFALSFLAAEKEKGPPCR